VCVPLFIICRHIFAQGVLVIRVSHWNVHLLIFNSASIMLLKLERVKTKGRWG
jgi:hypothetical protein